MKMIPPRKYSGLCTKKALATTNYQRSLREKKKQKKIINTIKAHNLKYFATDYAYLNSQNFKINNTRKSGLQMVRRKDIMTPELTRIVWLALIIASLHREMIPQGEDKSHKSI